MNLHQGNQANTTQTGPEDESNVLHLAICIPTFRNPAGLRALLESIKGQQFHKAVQPEIEIFIVDNDPEGSGKQVAETFERELPFVLHYAIEEKRGIPFVRNRLVELASHADFIAFIDDDEEATSHWLDELLFIQTRFQTQVVTGSVLARFETEPPNWAVAGKFYESSRWPTGSKKDIFFTNNLLIKSALIAQFAKPFEEAMALSGGTDTLLSMRVAEMGISAVWADEAVVYESIPANRATLRWYFQRRYRIGNVEVLCGRYLPEPWYRLRAVQKSIYLVPLGLIVIATSLWRGKHKIIRGVGYWYTAAGLLGGVLQRYQEEYGENYRRNQ
jgi:succinoglycan biosynthesis protein ExoM